MKSVVFILVSLLIFSWAPISAASNQETPSCAQIERRLAQEMLVKLSASAKGVAPSRPPGLLSESELGKAHRQVVLPNYDASTEGFFTGADGMKISYRRRSVPDERGAIVISPGFKQPALDFSELMLTLNQEGYSVYVYDPRGQGNSGYTSRDKKTIDVKSYDDYVHDLFKLLSIAKEEGHERIVVLGNSNGGLVSTLTLAKHPEIADAHIATVPAIQIQSKGIPEFLAKAILATRSWWMGPDSPAPFQGDLLKPVGPRLTHSDIRREIEQINAAENPDLARGGASNRWVGNALNAGKKARGLASSLQVPSLFISVGEDALVKSKAIEQFANESPVSSYLQIPGAYHAIHSEADKYRDTAMIEIFRFLVNPLRLDRPPKGDEIGALLKDVERYQARGEMAMARYAMDEALRVQRAKGNFNPEWKTPTFEKSLFEKSAGLWGVMNHATASEKALYVSLAERRKQELEKLYPRGLPSHDSFQPMKPVP